MYDVIKRRYQILCAHRVSGIERLES